MTIKTTATAAALFLMALMAPATALADSSQYGQPVTGNYGQPSGQTAPTPTPTPGPAETTPGLTDDPRMLGFALLIGSGMLFSVSKRREANFFHSIS